MSQTNCFQIRIALILLLCATIRGLASAEDDPPNAASIKTQPHYFIAAGEILANNAIVNLFDRLTEGGGSWADVRPDSWMTTLAGPWHFDQDPWSTNEIQHPIEGALYFTTGRSTGLGLWESAGGTAFGAFMWKLFGEVDDPNINDLVTTTMGGVVLGEMVHRLYFEAERAGSPSRFFISPMDAANYSLFGRNTRADGYSGASRISLSLEAGFVAPVVRPDLSSGTGQEGIPGSAGEFGESLTYGDPFGGSSAPFDYFEQRFSLQLSPTFWGIAFFSTGTLITLPLIDTLQAKLFVASCLHYDFIYNSLIELEANAVGISLLGEMALSGGMRFSEELHLDVIALGTSENTYLRELNGIQSLFEEGRDYDWGAGAGAKIHLGLSGHGLGALGLDCSVYEMQGIPGTTAAAAPFDWAVIDFICLRYEHGVAPRLSIGSAYSQYQKVAFYSSLSPVDDCIQSLCIYAKLAF